jgi:hypothetical protein
MYHGKTDATMGIVLCADTNTKQTIPSTELQDFTTEFYNLIETTSSNIVGKVFKLSVKQIKYVSAILALIMMITFFISAYYEKD